MLNKDKAIEVITKKSKSGSTYKTYKFKCLDCSNIISAQHSHLKTHSGKCRRCSQLGEPYAHIYNELKNHKNKKCSIDITFEEFIELISTEECHYCNTNLIFNKHSKIYNKNLSRAYQLDRKDNKLGYSKDNLVPCCWECNRLKSDIYSYEEFILIAESLKKVQKQRCLV